MTSNASFRHGKEPETWRCLSNYSKTHHAKHNMEGRNRKPLPQKLPNVNTQASLCLGGVGTFGSHPPTYGLEFLLVSNATSKMEDKTS